MSGLIPQGRAFNQSRQRYLATDLAVAQTHWSRLRGLWEPPNMTFVMDAASGFVPAEEFILLPCASRSM